MGAVSVQPEVEGMKVILDKFVPHHRRLVPQRVTVLESQALVEYPLEMGSYRLTFSKKSAMMSSIRFTLPRGEHWDGRDERGTQLPIRIPVQGRCPVRVLCACGLVPAMAETTRP